MNARLSYYLLHESNGYNETCTDYNIDRGVLKLKILRNNGMGGTRFATMRYNRWVWSK